MTNVAITGCYASGKSFILEKLALEGYQTFSSDNYIAKLYTDDQGVAHHIMQIAGMSGAFSKPHLAKAMFISDEIRVNIENYLHPMVLSEIQRLQKSNISNKLFFFEVPLLFEAQYDKYFDKSICVHCPYETRLKRAKLKSNFNLQNFYRINKIQYNSNIKKKRADFTIDSSKNLDIIKKQIKLILGKL